MAQGDERLAKLLGERMRARRQALGLAQGRVAELAEVSVELVSRIERGRGFPSVPTLVALARALDTTPDSLLGFRREGGPGIAHYADLSPSRKRDLERIAETFAKYDRR